MRSVDLLGLVPSYLLNRAEIAAQGRENDGRK